MIELTPSTPRKALNKAYLKVKPLRTQIEVFKANLIALLDGLDESESEEHVKNDLGDFLKNTFYQPKFYLNTKERTDLVIHNGPDSKSLAGVMIEAKKPSNKAEMITSDDLNKKAFHELILYYLRERISNHNLEIKHLVATNIFEWFVFDASLFEKTFAQNKTLVKQFADFEEGRLAGKTTDFFYKEIAAPFISGLTTEICFTWFDFREYEKPLRNDSKKDDSKLITLYKLLSPEHLLKLPFTNDSNSLDKAFYAELLHIIGLTETKEGSKKLIGRKKEGERNSGSLIESAITQLDSLDKISRLEKPSQFGETTVERLFNVALELSITWINRILFLKLLEAQLITYQKGDAAFAFLNSAKIQNFDDLNTLFFSALAKKSNERNEEVQKLFSNVPYLNSSLFEPTGLEHSCLFISQLQDGKLPVISSTVLKDNSGNKIKGELVILEYLFKFLDAYDFTGEGSEEIQEENKTLINASVLGLIFEKINGYKDGSFFTPGFITMYMCRETIRRAVVQKFNDIMGWNCSELGELYDRIENRKEANDIINSLKICDPAVGSGHFLVSSLNEIIAIKSELKVLSDRNGKRLKEYHVEVVNDELIVTDEDGDLFEYNPKSPESHRVQMALFHEKQTIIENCLFGVDINPNSVKICRLRLWIELLKNSYYKEPDFTELETLPNIDINIKCGNSLISRYALDADIKQALKQSRFSISSYRAAIMTYRNATSKEQKREMEKLIAIIKSDFQTWISQTDPDKRKRDKLNLERLSRFTGTFLFEPEADYGNRLNRDRAAAAKKKLDEQIESLDKKIGNKLHSAIFENAFEWRFEFPEVLNDEGDFIGFDVVIGNPPYGMITNESIKRYLGTNYIALEGRIDLFESFIERGLNISGPFSGLSFIIPNTLLSNLYSKKVRKLLVEKYFIREITNFGMDVFEDPTVHTCIISVSKGLANDKIGIRQKVSNQSGLLSEFDSFIKITDISENPNFTFDVTLNEYDQNLFKKFKNRAKLSDYCYIRQCIKTGDDEKYVLKSDVVPDNTWKKSLRGKGIHRFCILEDNVYLNYGNWLARNWKNTDFYERHKIAIRETGNRITACIDFDNRYFLSSLYAVYPKEEYSDDDLIYLLGLLNSTFATFVISKISFELTAGAFTKFRTNQLGRLPINLDNETCRNSIIAIVSQIIALKKYDPMADTCALEKEVDQLVYELYGLTEEEIKIVEGDRSVYFTS